MRSFVAGKTRPPVYASSLRKIPSIGLRALYLKAVLRSGSIVEWLRRSRQRFLRSKGFGRRFPSLSARDVAPNFYPAAIGVWRSVLSSWAGVAAVRGAEPSVERSAADRRCAA
jgi:hypothetical protein